MHYAETHVVPSGIKAGYPLNINFEAIPGRIANIRDDLQKIINGQLESWFRNLALGVYSKVGSRKAATPMVLMGRSEELRVSIKFCFVVFTIVQLLTYIYH